MSMERVLRLTGGVCGVRAACESKQGVETCLAFLASFVRRASGVYRSVWA